MRLSWKLLKLATARLVQFSPRSGRLARPHLPKNLRHVYHFDDRTTILVGFDDDDVIACHKLREPSSRIEASFPLISSTQEKVINTRHSTHYTLHPYNTNTNTNTNTTT
jgi:hypothetical protein